MNLMPTFTRRRSQYDLIVAVDPGLGVDHAKDVMERIAAAAPAHTHANYAHTYVEIGFRWPSADQARLYAGLSLDLAGLGDQSWCLRTGYGIHRRFIDPDGTVTR